MERKYSNCSIFISDNIIHYFFWEIIHLKDWNQILGTSQPQDQPNTWNIWLWGKWTKEPGLWTIHFTQGMWPCHIRPAWARCSLTHLTAMLLLCSTVSYRSGMKIIPSSLLTPPSGCSFQPDLICKLCCHQHLPRAHPSGLTLDLHACFPSTQPLTPAPFFQVRLPTKSRDLFKFSKIHYFVSKWWSVATFSFLSLVVN